MEFGRHCERSEAIHRVPPAEEMDCFVASLLAMTGVRPSGTISPLTHFEPCPPHTADRDRRKGTTMADRNGLKLVGFIFATVTLAVMLATGMVVKGYADGGYSLEHVTIATNK